MARKSVAKNYIFNLIFQMLTIFTPLITTPYLSRVLGAENIGIYGFTYSIITYFILFGSLGMATYGQREIAYNQENKDKRSKIFFEINIIKILTLTISMLIFYICFCLKGDYIIYYKILTLEIIANFFDISWFFQGVEEFDKTAIRNLVIKTFSIVLIFTLVKNQSDLWKYLLIFVFTDLLGNLSMWLYLPKYINRVKIKSLKFKKHIKPTLSLFIPQIAVQIYTVLDKTMIGKMTNDMESVGFYEQAQKIVKTALVIVTAYGGVMISRISNLYANKKKNEIKEALNTSFNFVWFLSFPIILGIIAISKKFVPIFYGPGYEEVIKILIITSPILLIIGLNSITGNQILIPIGKQNIYTISVTIGAIANIILNLILIHFFGTIGAVISSICAEIIILTIQLIYLRDRINFFEKLKLMPKCLISATIMFICVYFVDLKIDSSIISIIIEIIIGGLVYSIMLLILKYNFLYEVLYKIKGFILEKVKIGGKK